MGTGPLDDVTATYRVITHRLGDALVVAASGELHWPAAGSLRRCLCGHLADNPRLRLLVADLRQVMFIDEYGAYALAVADVLARHVGVPFRLAGHDLVRAVLESLGLGGALPVLDTADEALQSHAR